LELKTPAREYLIQEIPLKNPFTSKNIQLKAEVIMEEEVKKLFVFPDDTEENFLIPANSTYNYVIEFRPEWICEVTG